jgi:hypothetical protein
MMDVYLVPVGAERHELYCEVPDEPEADEQPVPGARPGLFRRLRERFREMLAEAERDRRQAHGSAAPKGWAGRVKARTMRWVAESIAEQRLLWHLRNQTDACLHFPDDVTESQAVTELRTSLSRDFEKHRFWLIIDLVGFIGSGLLMLVPGPNLIAYYFAFRLVGHFFSLRGARQGLNRVAWRHAASAPLAELRRAIELEPAVRVVRVHDVASRLRLDHLAAFVERIIGDRRARATST